MSSVPSYEQILTTVFGHGSLRAGQKEVIDALCEKRSALAIFPTGGGKSLCYQLPALLFEGLTIVISPLLALMKDQVDTLVARGVAAGRMDSSLSREEHAKVSGELDAGRLKLLYVSPEKLANVAFQKRLRRLSISMIAVDEAHCISEWGHNFRPDYLKVAEVCRKLKAPRVLALTATATVAVERDIRKAFRIKRNDVVKRSFHRKNLFLKISPTPLAERKAALLSRLQCGDKPAIVYVTRQETAEEVATFLAKNGCVAKAYHAGLRAELRREIQEQFMVEEIDVVVATIAFGMGVDKANIRAVYHYNLPKSLEGYSQEVGRAGRDGEPALCEMLADGDDLTVLENFIFSDIPSAQALKNLLHRVLRLGSSFEVSKYELSVSCDIRQTVIETIFTYLEMGGVLKAGEKFFETYRMKLLRPLDQVLAGRSGRERKVLRGVFAKLDAEWKWLTVPTSEVALETSVSVVFLRNLLEDLERSGEVVLKKSAWKQEYQRGGEVSVSELCEQMVERFEERESRELGRLGQVIAFTNSRTCLTRKLVLHFGEVLKEDCGHCSLCAGERPRKLQREKAREVTEQELCAIREIFAEAHATLATARQLTRFLCGMSSPASFRERLYKHSAYGLLADLPFKEVEVIAESYF